MKLLLENWREYLNEGMKTIDDIGEVIFNPPEKEGDHGRFLIYDIDPESDGALVGQVFFKQLPHNVNSCWDEEYKIYRISDISAYVSGYGPVLYDLVMEYASVNGDGLVPSGGKFGGNLSDPASKVWEKYLDRMDVVGEYIPRCKNYIYSKRYVSPSLVDQLKEKGKYEQI